MESPPRRPLDLVLLALGGAGLLNVVYLAVQESRGFEGGCSGFDPNVIAAPASGCGAALSSAYSTTLGISNTTLGLVFWSLLVLLGAAAWAGRAPYAALARQLRLALLGVGSVLAAFLTFVLFSGRSGGFCTFCFVSHVLTFLSLGVALAALRRSQASA